MLDLKELERKLDLALANETEESLNAWINLFLNKEKSHASKSKFFIKECTWSGLKSSLIGNSEPVNELINIEEIGGFYINTTDNVIINDNQVPIKSKIDDNFQKNMTPNFSESFFLYKLVA